MLSSLLNKIPSFNTLIHSNRRRLGTSPIFFNDGSTPEPSTRHMYKVNDFEKKILVWTGKYKNVQDVPHRVPPEVMDKARSRLRIRVANWLMASTLVLCVIAAYMGKQSHKSGDSLEKRNLEMHRKYQEQFVNKEDK